MDKNYFENLKPLEKIGTEVGEIAIYSITVGEEIEVFKLLKKKLEDSNPIEFFKIFINFVCHKTSSLNSDENKPINPTLTSNDIDKFSKDELEAIAKCYVTHNDYLSKSSEFTSEKNEKGVTVLSIKYGDIVFPKLDNENYIEYLYRLTVEQQKKLEKSSERFRNTFDSLANFSNDLRKSIQGTLSLGESLSKSFEKIRSINIPKAKIVSVKPPKDDLSKLRSISSIGSEQVRN